MAKNIGLSVSDNASVHADSIKILMNITKTAQPKSLRMIQYAVPNFVGRQNQLDEIRRLFHELASNSNVLERMVVITGSAGMGKSELAKRYAENCKDIHPNAALLNSESEASLEDSFIKLAYKLEILKKAEDGDGPQMKRMKVNIHDVLPKVYKKLSDEFKDTLLVFDNAVSLQSYPEEEIFGIQDYLPKDDLNHMPSFLVTSRHEHWQNIDAPIKVLSVPLLESAETTLFLSKSFNLSSEKHDQEIESLLCTLASSLGGFPFGLSMLSSFWPPNPGQRRRQHDLRGVLKSLIKKFESLQKDFQDGNETIKNDQFRFEQLKAMFDAQIESVKALREKGGIAIDLLEVIAYLDPDRIDAQTCYAICESKRPTQYQDCESGVYTGPGSPIGILEERNFLTVHREPGGRVEVNIDHLTQRLMRDRLILLSDTFPIGKVAKFLQFNEYEWDDDGFSYYNRNHSRYWFYVVKILMADLRLNLRVLVRLFTAPYLWSSFSFRPGDREAHYKALLALKTYCQSSIVKEEEQVWMILVEFCWLLLDQNWYTWMRERSPNISCEEEIQSKLHLLIEACKIGHYIDDLWKLALGLRISQRISCTVIASEILGLVFEILDASLAPPDELETYCLLEMFSCVSTSYSAELYGDTVGQKLGQHLLEMYATIKSNSLRKYWTVVLTFLETTESEFAESFASEEGIRAMSESLQSVKWRPNTRLSDNVFRQPIFSVIQLFAGQSSIGTHLVQSPELLHSFKQFTELALKSLKDEQDVNDLKCVWLTWLLLAANSDAPREVFELVEAPARRWLYASKEMPRYIFLDTFSGRDFPEQMELIWKKFEPFRPETGFECALWIALYSCKIQHFKSNAHLGWLRQNELYFQVFESTVRENLKLLKELGEVGQMALVVLRGLSFINASNYGVSMDQFQQLIDPQLLGVAKAVPEELRSKLQECLSLLQKCHFVMLENDNIYTDEFLKAFVRQEISTTETARHLNGIFQRIWNRENMWEQSDFCCKCISERDDTAFEELSPIYLKFWLYNVCFKQTFTSSTDPYPQLTVKAVKRCASGENRENTRLAQLGLDLQLQTQTKEFDICIILNEIFESMPSDNKGSWILTSFPTILSRMEAGVLEKFLPGFGENPLYYLQDDLRGVLFRQCPQSLRLTIELPDSDRIVMNPFYEFQLFSKQHWILKILLQIATSYGVAEPILFWGQLQEYERSVHHPRYITAAVVADLVVQYLKRLLERPYFDFPTVTFDIMRQLMVRETRYNDGTQVETLIQHPEFLKLFVQYTGSCVESIKISENYEELKNVCIPWIILLIDVRLQNRSESVPDENPSAIVSSQEWQDYSHTKFEEWVGVYQENVQIATITESEAMLLKSVLENASESKCQFCEGCATRLISSGSIGGR